MIAADFRVSGATMLLESVALRRSKPVGRHSFGIFERRPRPGQLSSGQRAGHWSTLQDFLILGPE